MKLNKKQLDKKEWKKNNKEKVKASAKKYREKHKEEIKEYTQKYYKHNMEKIKKYQQQWHQENKEKELTRSKKWKEENIERFRELKSKAQKKYYKKYPLKVKAVAMAKQVPLKSSCEICNSKEKLERHHWRYDKPLIVNTLCNDCHRIQHIKNFGGSQFGI